MQTYLCQMREVGAFLSCCLYNRFFKQQIIKVWFPYHKTRLHTHILFPNDDHMGESCFGMCIYQHPTAGCYEKNIATTACPLFVEQFIEIGGTNGRSIEIPVDLALVYLCMYLTLSTRETQKTTLPTKDNFTSVFILQ